MKQVKPYSPELLRLASDFAEQGHRLLAVSATLGRIGKTGRALEIYPLGPRHEVGAELVRVMDIYKENLVGATGVANWLASPPSRRKQTTRRRNRESKH